MKKHGRSKVAIVCGLEEVLVAARGVPITYIRTRRRYDIIERDGNLRRSGDVINVIA